MSTKSQKQHDFFNLYDRYISAIKRGKHLQKNGKRISKNSIRNYSFVRAHLVNFCESKGFRLRIISTNRMNKRDFMEEQNYWKRFYIGFTSYMYEVQDLSDNYVGGLIKLLRSFFNYLNHDLGLNIGTFHKDFYPHHEDIQIVVLSPERLNFLIYNKKFEESLTDRLKRTKDIFVFGCTVALRYSDLVRLKPTNIERINDQVFLSVFSQKTETFTRVWLPQYAVEIIERRMTRQSLLPYFNKSNLNKYVKELMEKAGWTEPFDRRRKQRGIPVPYYKDKTKKIPFRFCDMVTTHTMRRTAITTLLSLGMDEQSVRDISGHAASSKEFYRYVKFSQADHVRKMKIVHQTLQKRLLEVVE